MCCNTRPGPRAAIAFFKKKTGIHVTQADWHKIRTVAEINLGRPLTNKVADAHTAAIVAADFADSLAATPEEKMALIEEMTSVRSTDGNIEAVRELSENGLPAEVRGKKARVSAQQRADMAATPATEPADVPWGDAVEKSVWQRAQIKIVGVSNYADATVGLVDDEPLYVEHEPTNAHDPNAMRVYKTDGQTVGYLPREVARRVLTETGESAFTAHLAYTTSHDGRTVGGSLMLDQPMRKGQPQEESDHREWLGENGRLDSDNLPDEETAA